MEIINFVVGKRCGSAALPQFDLEAGGHGRWRLAPPVAAEAENLPPFGGCRAITSSGLSVPAGSPDGGERRASGCRVRQDAGGTPGRA